MNYGEPGGYFPLRVAVADYVYSHRGIKCDPRHVIVTAATEKSLHLTASLLIDPGDKVLIEDPARNTLLSIAVIWTHKR
jgi:GntR family transcriptional regulator/MocR family aminotransferase